ncbi:MAG: hypothetical protein HUU46_03730 [Candidatus Hydrogenedentes bacterium]|nr:hypothetical protein [Candidatus Hydrogenedentota bacterium]
MRVSTAIVLLCVVAIAGCSQQSSAPQPPPAPPPAAAPTGSVEARAEPEHDDHEHHHTAPHGGTLILVGDHAGQLEFVLEPATGALTMYALDGEAENAVRLNSLGIAMNITIPGKPAFDIQLKPVENVLTGETTTSTSQYAAQSDDLKGVTEFGAVIPELSFRGMEFENVEIAFPEGNE